MFSESNRLTALKTLSLRVRGYDEETEELSNDVVNAMGKVADLTKVASNGFAGVSLWTDASQTEYRSLVDYLGDIADIWDEIDAKSQTQLLEKLFGKRTAGVGSAILLNFDQVRKALEEMESAEGAADAEMKIIQESLTYKMNTLKETWIGTLQEMVDRGDIGAIIDFLTKVSEILGVILEHIGAIGAIGIGTGIFGFVKGHKDIIKTVNSFKSLVEAAQKLDDIDPLAMFYESGNWDSYFDAVKESVSDLSGEEAANMLITQGMTNSQILNTLSLEGEEKAAVEAMLAEKGLAVSESEAAIATDAHTLSAKNLIVALKSTKTYGALVGFFSSSLGQLALAAGAVVAVLGTMVIVTDAVTTSIEEAHDAAEKAKSDLSSTNDEIETLKKELEGVNEKIQEINSQDKITLEDEHELEKLERENELLEAQIGYRERIANIQSGVSATTAITALNATDPWYKNPTKNLGLNIMEQAKSQAARINEYQKELIQAYNDGASETELEKIRDKISELSDAYSENYENVFNYYKTLTDYRETLLDDAGNVKDGMDGELAYIDSEIDKVNEVFDVVNGWKSISGDFQSALDIVHPEEGFEWSEEQKLQYIQLATYIKDFNNEEKAAWLVATKGAGSSSEAILKYEQYCLKAIASLEGVETAAENAFSVATITDAVDDIDKQLKPQFDELGEAWKAIFEDDETTIDLSVVDNDLKQGISDAFMNIAEDIGVNFEDASEEVNKFLKVISDQSSNVDQVQEAFDDLATAYFYSAEGLKNVNSETAESIKQSLQKLGVSNAEVLVEQALADAELEEKVATELATGAKIGEIQQLLNEASASDTARVAAFQLAAQEKILNNQKLSFSEKISSLKQYASALLETADAARMQSHIDQIAQQTMYGVSQEDINNKINSYIANYTPLSLKPVEVEFNPIKYNPDAGGSSSGGSGGGGGSDSTKEADKFYQVLDWIERKIAAVQKQIDKFGKIASGTWRTWAQRARATNKEIERTKRLIDVNKTAAKEYEKAANNVVKTSKGKGVYVDKDGNKHNLNAGDRYYTDDNGDKRKLTDKQVKKLEDLQKKYKTGLLGPGDISSISNEKVYNAFTQWQEWYDKQLDAESAWYDARDQLAQEYMERFQLTETKYENILSKYEHQANMLAKRVEGFEINGLLASHSNLNKEAEIVENQLRNTNKEIDALLKKRTDAVNEGNIEKGSEEWYEMTKAIWSAKEQAKDYENTLDEIAKKHRELDWERFDLLQQKISRVSSEAQFLGELLSSKKLVNSIDQYTTTQLDNDKNLFKGIGNLTKEGMAALGMYGVQYEVAARQMDNLRDEYAKLQKQLKERPYDQNIINRLEELQDEMQSTGKTIQDVENSIIELRRQQIEADIAGMTKLVDLYQTALDEQKSLSDYQKNVSDQSRNISTLQKQIVAYQGDTSEENRARLQKLNKELIDAQKNLEETETEHLISEQKKMLDNLVTEYSEILTLTLNNPEAIVKEMMADMNTNQQSIKTTIESTADNVGYQVSSQMETILQSEQIASLYKSHDYTSSISGVATTLGEIKNKVDEWIKHSEATSGTGSSGGYYNDDNGGSGNAGSGNTGSGNAGSGNTGSGTNPSTPIGNDKVEARRKLLQQKEQLENEIALHSIRMQQLMNEWWNTNDSAKRAKLQKKYDNQESQMNQKQGKLKSVVNQLQNFAVGAHNLSKDEMAWTQEEGDEVIIRKRDGAILTPLKRGDSVLTAAQTENLYNLARIPTNELKMALRGAGGNTNVTSLNNNSLDIGDVSFNITLPNVSNYKDFKEQMKNDKSMETYLRSVTTDRLFKGSALKKYNT